MGRDKIRGSLVVCGNDVKYGSDGLYNFVDHFLEQEKFQRLCEKKEWDSIDAEKFSLEPYSDSGFDAWPNIYVLGRMQNYEEWASRLEFSDIITEESRLKRVLIFEESGLKKYSLGDLWTLSCKFMDCAQNSSAFGIFGDQGYDLVFDNSKVAFPISSLRSERSGLSGSGRSESGWSGFCKRFEIDH